MGLSSWVATMNGNEAGKNHNLESTLVGWGVVFLTGFCRNPGSELVVDWLMRFQRARKHVVLTLFRISRTQGMPMSMNFNSHTLVDVNIHSG